MRTPLQMLEHTLLDAAKFKELLAGLIPWVDDQETIDLLRIAEAQQVEVVSTLTLAHGAYRNRPR